MEVWWSLTAELLIMEGCVHGDFCSGYQGLRHIRGVRVGYFFGSGQVISMFFRSSTRKFRVPESVRVLEYFRVLECRRVLERLRIFQSLRSVECLWALE